MSVATELDTLHTFANLNEALNAHAEFGGILLLLDNGKYQVCSFCPSGTVCGRCSRTAEWLDSLAPSYSEAAHANMIRDPRNSCAAVGTLKIAQLEMEI